jgi:lysophospholipase L1-like esterase
MKRIEFIGLFAGAFVLLSAMILPRSSALHTQVTPPTFETHNIDYHFLATEFPFINTDHNRLFTSGDKHPLAGFFLSWEKLLFRGEGKINVYHIGGSHVQAGMFGNRMRENFHAVSNDIAGERGFFFPYKVAGTNGPAQFKIEYDGKWEACRNAYSKHSCDWGLAGIQASTRDEKARISLIATRADGRPYPFHRVRIFHPNDSTLYCLDTEMPGLKSITVDTLGRWTVLEFDRLHDTLSFRVRKMEDHERHFTLGGISLEHDIPGLTYNEIGVNGAGVPSYLRSPYFADEMRHRPADLVIFGIGINDANVPVAEFSKEDFKRNYRQLMNRVREANPKAEFLFITNNDSYYNKRNPNKNAITVRQAMMELAEEENAAVWDFFEIMGGLGSIAQWQKAGLAKADKIHFTLSGYELMGDLLFDALRTEFIEHLRNKYLANQQPD